MSDDITWTWTRTDTCIAIGESTPVDCHQSGDKHLMRRDPSLFTAVANFKPPQDYVDLLGDDILSLCIGDLVKVTQECQGQT